MELLETNQSMRFGSKLSNSLEIGRETAIFLRTFRTDKSRRHRANGHRKILSPHRLKIALGELPAAEADHHELDEENC